MPSGAGVRRRLDLLTARAVGNPRGEFEASVASRLRQKEGARRLPTELLLVAVLSILLYQELTGSA
jgi:hypothetical protein